MRSASNVLFQKWYGVQHLPALMAWVPLFVLVVLAGYNSSLSRLGPRRTLFWSTIFSGVALLLCYLSLRAGWRFGAVILYWWREAYIVLLIEQYWSFLNSRLSEEEEKKLNGPIIGVSSVGAVLGGIAVNQLAVPLGTQNLLLFGAGALVPAAFLSDAAYRLFGGVEARESKAKGTTPTWLGAKLVKRSRLLSLIFALIITTQIVSAALGINFQEFLQASFSDWDAQTAYSGKYYAILNGVAALFQFIVTPLLLKGFPFIAIHTFIPCVHIAAGMYLLAVPSLASAGLAYMAFKVFDYSLFRAAKEILYVPLNFDARYRAKEFIDVFGYRFGKGGASAAFFVFQKAGVVVNSFYTGIALAGAVLWAGIVWALFKGGRGKGRANFAAGDIARLDSVQS